MTFPFNSIALKCPFFFFTHNFLPWRWSNISFSIHFTEFLWRLNKVIMWKIFKKYKLLETLSILMILFATCGKSLMKSTHWRSGINYHTCLLSSYLKSLINVNHIIQLGLRIWSRGVRVMQKPNQSHKSFCGAFVAMYRVLPWLTWEKGIPRRMNQRPWLWQELIQPQKLREQEQTESPAVFLASKLPSDPHHLCHSV